MATPPRTQVRWAGSWGSGDQVLFDATGVAARLCRELNALGETPLEIARALTEREMSLPRFITELLHEEGEPWVIPIDGAGELSDIRVEPEVIVVEARASYLTQRLYITIRPGIALELFLRHLEDPRYYPDYTSATCNEPVRGQSWP